MLTFFKKNAGLFADAGIASLAISLFLTPFTRSWSLYPLGAFLFFGLCLWIADYSELISSFRKRIIILLPLILYFFLFIAGLFFTVPRWSHIEGNLMFLLIPLFGFPILSSEKFPSRANKVLQVFIFGIVIVCIFEYSMALIKSIDFTDYKITLNPDPGTGESWFRWERLSLFEHPTYLSMKVLMAVSILFFYGKEILKSRALKIFGIGLLLLFTYSLSSRMGLLSAFLLIIFFLSGILKEKGKRYFLIPLIPAALAILFAVSAMNQRVADRSFPVWKRYIAGELKIKEIDPRFASWFTAGELIMENPIFGVGLDVREIITEEYLEDGFTVEASLRFNAHNQFLETQLTFGIAGTLLLLWMVAMPFVMRKRAFKNLLVIPFMIIILTSMTFESILVRQWGIMFFLIFYSILLIPSSEEKSENTDKV